MHPDVNAFSSPIYLQCVAEALYPGRRYAIEDSVIEGRTFRLARFERKGLTPGFVMTHAPFLDFLEPLAPSLLQRGVSDAPDFLPSVSLGKVSAAAWHSLPDAAKQPFVEAPLIDFTLFPTWEAFVTYSRATKNAGFRSQRARQLRKLHEERGVSFTWHDPTPAALAQVMQWKSQQYRASGFEDGFVSPRLRRMFELLHARGKLVVTTMRVAGELVAGHAGMEHDGRFYYWLPAYDAAWAKQGVGSMMIEWMIQQSYERKHREFDFLIGGEAYKWAYATHARVIGELGLPPLGKQLWTPVRARLVHQLKKHPRLFSDLRTWRLRAFELFAG